MKLVDLIQDIPGLTPLDTAILQQAQQREVFHITSDSRKVRNGSLFVALVGEHTDGHQYLTQAIEAGATALVIEAKRQEKLPKNLSLPVWVVDNTYQALAQLSAQFYGYPGKHLRLVGVTGTNGKTTVTHLVQKMLQDWGQQVGLIGTLGRKTGASTSYDNTGHTTPMAVELQEILAEMRQDGASHVVMEVSSHALDQYRVAGCDFDVAVVTNLTQDHLDFHKTMEHYFQAKAKLFQQLSPTAEHPKFAVINLDDAYGKRFLEACPPGVTCYSYGIQSAEAAIRAESVQYSITGASFQAITPQGTIPVSLKIAGQFSVYNALAALATGLGLGIPLENCVRSLGEVGGVRGRFEVVSEEPFVIVDYAHTPDGLQNILQAARLVIPEGGRLIAVFGCGGDRDATKRPKMGGIAEALADILVVTSDNPRTEDPQQILTDILSGIQRFDPQRMMVNVDREKAIHQAIELAQPQDIIVVAGKGHEDYQILADRVIHFDDKEVVQAYVAEKKSPSLR